MKEIYDQLHEIFWDIFDDNTIVLSEETAAKDIEGWDSLVNINIIFAVEETFGIKFSVDEITGMKCVGDMVKLILEKCN